MPTYLFEDNNTHEQWIDSMSISERTEYLESNPHITQLVYGAPMITGGVDKKPEAGFRDLLKDIKRSNSRGLKRSSIETF